MSWSDKLGDLVLGGIGGVLSHALPEHWRRRARERLSDFNPWDVIAGNHDLVRAARLAWVRAALEVLDAARDASKAAPHEFGSATIVPFEQLARDTLLKIRYDALDRRTAPGASPIDGHVQIIMQGTAEFVAPGEAGALDQRLTTAFETTFAALTGWKVHEIPALFGQIARAGLPTIDGSVRRNFSDLVFATFAELLKSRDQYPEALPAFNIAMDHAALKLSQSVLARVTGIEDKVDQLLDGADALKVLQTGAQDYLAALPKLLEGQQRIEALVSLLPAISSKLNVVGDDVKAIRRFVENIPPMLRAHPETAEQDIRDEVERLNAHLARGEFEQVLASEKPRSLEAYRARCIARWSQVRYAIDKQFTPLTLLLDQGEEAGKRYQKATREFTDLRDVLAAIDPVKEPVIVVTGAPGSGKSTLLRRLELDFASDALRSGDANAPLTISLPLNAFGQRGSAIPDPAVWIAEHWAKTTEGLPRFDELLRRPLLLLLDGLNEMPHASDQDYDDRLTEWKAFLDRLVREHPKVRVVFSCRTLDYGAKLSTKELTRIPQVEVNPLTPEQVQEFLKRYSPQYADALFAQLKDSQQFDLYRSPYYLKLLIEQAEDGKIPEGRAALFTGYVRAMLKREIDGRNPRFEPGALLAARDRNRFGQWTTPHELPARGLLFKALAAFAFRLQERRGPGDKSQVRVDYDAALENLSDIPAEQQDTLLKAAADLQVLELPGNDVLFVHQLLQEYFAARELAQRANSGSQELEQTVRLARVNWLEADITPNVTQELLSLPKSGTLPDLPTTGWEETFSLAAAMMPAADELLRVLATVNLPLAGRCAAQVDVKLADGVRQYLQQALLTRSRDPATGVRARILAASALGVLGDPRFERRHGPHGAYLLPPMIAVADGIYRLGSDEGIQGDEAPHEVQLTPFSLGQFPVTNAEFRCFIDAGGYEDERWWETQAAKRWRLGEGTAEGSRRSWRKWRDYFKAEPERLSKLADDQAWQEDQLKSWQDYCAMSDATFESELDRRWPEQRFVEPAVWRNTAYSAPNQPVVGVCWHEARAYCTWLSAQTGQHYTLPSEAQWEAAARGKDARRYAWGEAFEPTLGNSIELKLRRTTPIGVFSLGDTPEGLADISGNVWDWTSSVYRPYPYQAADGRENVNNADDPRVLRGGSWDYSRDGCRCAYRDRYGPGDRYVGIGFRVCCAPPII